ncbi:MAG: fibrobacter succinogenes major paralogous domain-containing protein, partial [Flavobacteriales bacterium]|nr:fibrobacter succinogenes major paralogous domain-containing protein [Flavobacteriales bacterium]
ENLRTGSYRNGTPIPEVQDNAQWNLLTSGAWCAYENDPGNEAIYGKLYNWYAADDAAGLCPQGWHVPTDDEWKELESTLGMPESELDAQIFRGVDANVGGQMKSTSPLWNQPNLGANDLWGFAVLPSGFRDSGSNTYQMIGDNGTFWSLPEISASSAWQRYLSSYDQGVIRLPDTKRGGAGVRCVLD